MSEPESSAKSLTLDYPDAELVFAVVCAVGTDYRPVVDYLRNLLRRARYTPEELHVSDFFPEIVRKLGLELEFPTDDEYKRIDAGMRAGDAIREKTQDPGFLAMDAASRIFSTRPENDSDEPAALPHTAHIIVSLKREEEVEILRKIYGPGFFLIGIFASEQERRDYLETEKGVYGQQLSELIERDQKEEDRKFGQRTRDTFEHADVFVSLKDAQYKKGLRSFLQLVFGYPYATPTKDEYGMFLAYSASARSGALARQVGAAILSTRGDLMAVGCNDVPAPGGGLYWEDGVDDHREHKKGEDSNDRQKRRIVEGAADKFEGLAKEKWDDPERLAVLRDAKTLGLLREAVSSAIGDITEFGRSVHAEMDAITTCARTGVPVAGATLFTTTMPCHNCTRHIVAAGIRRVVYIEPYPKSQAGALHGDAICLAPCGESDSAKKIPFEPFVGIGPRRFFDLFSLKLSAGYRVERKVQGEVIGWRLETHAKPRVPMAPTSYLQREQYVSRTIVEIYREKGSQSGGSRAAIQDGRSILGADAKDSSPSRKVASMESGREVKPSERTGTFDDGHDTLFKK
jgi:deoxycytidylate deaminase